MVVVKNPQKIHVKRWKVQKPCVYGGAMRGTLPDGAHLWLHAKPLDAAIGQVPAPYCPGGRHGRQFLKEKKTLTKHNFYLAFSR
jgi:hypothetical protein